MSYYDRYIPIEMFSKKVVSGNDVTFNIPYECKGAIAFIRQVTTGAYYATGLKITFGKTEGQNWVKVAGTSLSAGDVVSVIVFKDTISQKGTPYDRYVPFERFVKVADAADAEANAVIFPLPYKCEGAVAQVKVASTDVLNTTGLKVEMLEVNGAHFCKVSVTSLAAGDIVTLIAFRGSEGKDSLVYYDRYMPIEAHCIKVDADAASAKAVVFNLPYLVTGAIAQIRADDGTDNPVEKIVIAEDDVTGQVTVTVSIASTGTLAQNSIVSLIAFK